MTTNEIIRLTKFNSMPRVSYAAACTIGIESTRRRMHYEGSDFPEADVAIAALRALATLIKEIEGNEKRFEAQVTINASLRYRDKLISELAAGFDPNAAIHPEGAAE